MEETELDEWFTAARERLEENYFVAISAGKDSEKAKAVFDKNYKTLITGLQTRQEHIYESRRRSAALKAPFARFSANIKLQLKRLSDRWDNRSHPFRKWRFERKVRRILKDKSDL